MIEAGILISKYDDGTLWIVCDDEEYNFYMLKRVDKYGECLFDDDGEEIEEIVHIDNIKDNYEVVTFGDW